MNSVDRFASSLLALLVLAGSALPTLAASEADTALAQRYLGGFVLVGERNVSFDVIVRADGTAHATLVEGPGRAAGEAGRWRPYGNGVLIEYGSGWRDWLRVGDAAGGQLMQQATWQPQQSLLDPPFATARVLPIDEARAPFVGVFAIELEAGAASIDVTLQSSGRAFSNAGGAEQLVPGVWWVEEDKARMIWADGWRNEFRRKDGVWSHRTWKPGALFASVPWKSAALQPVAVLP